MSYTENSNWVWSPSWSMKDTESAKIMLFRKTIEVKGKPSEGTIRISADTRYKLYINEKLVEVGPGRGDHHVWFYDTISLLPWMKQAIRTICRRTNPGSVKRMRMFPLRGKRFVSRR